MGCFDSTCAFTRTAIHRGDQVLLVGVRPLRGGEKFDTYRLMQELDYYDRQYQSYLNSKSEDKARTESLKALSEAIGIEYKEEVEKTFDVPHPLRFAVIGKYNDYGYIDGLDAEQQLEDPDCWIYWQFFVHKYVVEELIGNKLDSTTDLYKVVDKLLEIAFLARIQVAGNNSLGTQYADNEEFQLQKKILQLTKYILNRKVRNSRT